MGRMKKRLVAWFMVMTMVVTAVPVSVLAANEELNISPVLEEGNLDNEEGSTYVEDVLPEGVDEIYESEDKSVKNTEIQDESLTISEEKTGEGEITNPADVKSITIVNPPLMQCYEGDHFNNFSLVGMKVTINYGDDKEFPFEFINDEDWDVDLNGTKYSFGFGCENENTALDGKRNWLPGNHKLNLSLWDSVNGREVGEEFFDVTVKPLETCAKTTVLGTASDTENLSPGNACVFSFKLDESGVYKMAFTVDAIESYEYQLFDSNKDVIKEDSIVVPDYENPGENFRLTANMEAGSLYYLKLRLVSDSNSSANVSVTVKKHSFKSLKDVKMTQSPQINYVSGIDYGINFYDFKAELTFEDGSTNSIDGSHESHEGYYAVWDDSVVGKDELGELLADSYSLNVNVYSPEDQVVATFPITITVKTKDDFFNKPEDLNVEDIEVISENQDYLVYTFTVDSTGSYKVLSEEGDFEEALLYNEAYQPIENPGEHQYWNTVYCDADVMYYLVIKGWKNYEQNKPAQLKVVKNRKINSISLEAKPSKYKYFIWRNEETISGGLDYSGLSVRIEYEGGNSEVLDYGNYYTDEKYQVECYLENGVDGDMLEAGIYQVNVQLGDKILENAFQIDVQSSFEYIRDNVNRKVAIDENVEGKVDTNTISGFIFTPNNTGTYFFEGLFNGRGYLYDKKGEEIGNIDRDNEKICADLTAGENYYYGICSYSDEENYKAKVTQAKAIESISLDIPERLRSYVVDLQDKRDECFWNGLSAAIQYTDGSEEELIYGNEENAYGYMITLGGEFMEKFDGTLQSKPYSVDVKVGAKTASFNIQVTSLRDYFGQEQFEGLEVGVEETVTVQEGLYKTFVFTAPDNGYYRGVYNSISDSMGNAILNVYDEEGQRFYDKTISLAKDQKVYWVLNNFYGTESTYQLNIKNLSYKLEKIEIIHEPEKQQYIEELDYAPGDKPVINEMDLGIRAYYSDDKTEELSLNDNGRDGERFNVFYFYNWEEESKWLGFGVGFDSAECISTSRFPCISLEKYILSNPSDIMKLEINSEKKISGNKTGVLYSVRPMRSGEYKFYTTGYSSTQGSILNELGNKLISAQGREEEGKENFAITYNLIAGTTYYFLVNSLNYSFDLDTTVHLTGTTVQPPVPVVTPSAPTDITIDVVPEKKEDGTVVIPDTIPPTQIADIEKSLEQADENKEMVINIPQSEGNATEIPADIISKAIESNIDTLKIQTTAVDGDEESIDATFTIDVSKGTQLNAGVGSINTGIKATIGDAAEKIADEKIPDDAKTLKLELAHEGPFPVPVTITLSVGKLYNPGDVVYLYYINEKTGKVELIGGGPLTVTAGGTVEITLEHASSYVLTDKPEIEEEPSIKLNVKSMKLEAGKTRKLKVTVTPEDSKIAWKSSNSKVVSVGENGSVKGIKPGTATITATADSGLTATCKVTVVIKKMPVPASVKAVSGGYNSIKITWKKVNNATTYYVYRATSKNGKYKRIGTAKKNSYTDKKLLTGKTYYYKVKSGYKKVYSPVSKVTSAYPRPQRPVVKAKAGKKAVALSWKRISGATGYTIYRASSKNGKYSRVKVIGSGKTVKYTDKSLKSKKAYYYKVRANRKISSKKTIQSISSKISYAKTK